MKKVNANMSNYGSMVLPPHLEPGWMGAWKGGESGIVKREKRERN